MESIQNIHLLSGPSRNRGAKSWPMFQGNWTQQDFGKLIHSIIYVTMTHLSINPLIKLRWQGKMVGWHLYNFETILFCFKPTWEITKSFPSRDR